MTEWTAVVLAGGRGRRLGGVDKAAIEVDGRSLLDMVLGSIPEQVPVVVVGPTHPTPRAVTFTLEEPRYGGPVAAVAAALGSVSTPLIGLLAVDMPRSPELIAWIDPRSLGADVDAVVCVDGDGRTQPMGAVYRVSALTQAIERLGDPAGQSMRGLLALLRVETRRLADAAGELTRDIDEPEDLDRLARGD